MAGTNPIIHLLSAALALCSCAEEVVSIIPEPAEMSVRRGYYCKEGTTDYGNEAKILIDSSLRPSLGSEGYKLAVRRGGIRIEAASGTGVFYGKQTIRQLTGEKGVKCVTITDMPRFPYRGMHLDVSRHFFSKEEVMKLLDEMAYFKLNNFHFHLTDNGGWRIEIDSYPLLTSQGSYRPTPDFSAVQMEKPFCQEGTVGAYGGYYTKDDIREIVAYAAGRKINVIPEIDLPAHSDAVFAGYPELNCNHVRSGNGEFCTANEASLTFACKVLDEVMELFPSKMIHIGGDEARKEQWKLCPDCNELMRRNGWTDYEQLQIHFMRKVEEHVRSKGRTIAGWDELLNDEELPKETVLYSYRGQKYGITAANAGYRTVMTPGEAYYFDWWQANPLKEPVAMGGYSPLKKVYAFNPAPACTDEVSGNEALMSTSGINVDSLGAILPENAGNVIGVQGCIWTEFILDIDHLHYMTFPRLLAVAETGWSPAGKKSWENFKRKLPEQIAGLGQRGIFCYDLHDAPEISVGEDLKVRMDCERWGAEIRYTLDSSEPTCESTLYTGPFSIVDTTVVKAAAFESGSMVTYIREMTLVPGQSRKPEYPTYWQWEIRPGQPHPFRDPLSFGRWKENYGSLFGTGESL
ncbi:MAG: beta-N-acetylhexosaminidase [Candidatus Cryptobacteroides sp.]